MNKTRLGFALCGSFCTFSKALVQMEELIGQYEIIPIMSETAYNTDTRFGSCEEIRDQIELLTQKNIIHTIVGAEPIGPKNMVDVLLIAPCTGNTVGKISCGITDTAVTMAVKSALRIGIPVVLCVATNDGLGASARNIGRLMNTKNIFFVPMRQDDPVLKPCSLVADFSKISETLTLAIEKIQTQPVFF
ncbi:MAG: dipicolinate synthase subunit B [Oscillospiraceae bacterium]